MTRTSKQISNQVNYLVKKLGPREENERFQDAFKRRHASVDSTGDGMAERTMSATGHQRDRSVPDSCRSLR